MASGAGPHFKCGRQRKIPVLFHSPTILAPVIQDVYQLTPAQTNYFPRANTHAQGTLPLHGRHPTRPIFMSGQYRHHMTTSASHPIQGAPPVRLRRPSHNAASNQTQSAPLSPPSGRRTMWWPSHWSRILIQSRLRNRAIRLGRHRPGRAHRRLTKSLVPKT